MQLTPLEFRILYLLAINEGRVIPYSRLVEYAWGYYDEGNSSLLKTHICHIRKKLGLATSGQRRQHQGRPRRGLHPQHGPRLRSRLICVLPLGTPLRRAVPCGIICRT